MVPPAADDGGVVSAGLVGSTASFVGDIAARTGVSCRSGRGFGALGAGGVSSDTVVGRVATGVVFPAVVSANAAAGPAAASRAIAPG